MNKLFTLSTFSLLLLFSTFTFSQTPPPEGINYQAVARDTAGKPLSSSLNLMVKFTILADTSGSGTIIFTEIHSPVNTNRYGLFTLVIGSIETTDFQNLDWAAGDKFLEVEIATVGGSYTSMGKTRMMSVPYALHSKTSGSATNNWGLQGNSLSNPTDFIGTNNSQDLVVKTAGSEKMRVQSGGNVGIGTSNPASLFSVGAASEFRVDSTGAIDTATGIISSGVIRFSGLSPDGIVRSTGSNGTLMSGLVNLTSEVTDSLPVANGGTGLTSLGNWQAFYSDGLGAFTPFALGDSGKVFQSNGPASAPSWSAPSSLMQNLTNGTGISPFIYNGSTAAAINMAPSGITAGTYTSIVSGQTITIPNFTVNAQGQITAASSPPLTFNAEAPLTFNNGLTRNVNTIQLGGPLTQNTTITGGGFNTLFDLNSTGDFSINKNGNLPAFFVNPANGDIGIGTTSPGAKLEVNGTIKIVDGTEGAGKMLTSDAAGLASWTTPVSGSGTLNYIPKWTPNGTTLGNSRIFDNGTYIGIGTINPAAGLVISGSSLYSSALGIENTTASMEWRIATTTTGMLNFIKFTGTPLTAISINPTSGNVGIGTAPSTAKLHSSAGIFGTGSAGTFDNFNNTNSSHTLVANTNGSGNAIVASNTGTSRAGTFTISNTANINDALYAETNGTGSAIYGKNTNTGKAGTFQVLNPASTADAVYVTTNGNGSNAFNVSHTGTSNSGINYGAYVKTNGTRTAVTTTNVGGYFTASGAANNYAAIFDQGNVGIGTASPSAKLEVAGQVKITGGSPGAGKVLTSDGVGLATWAAGASPAWALTGNSATTPSSSSIGVPIVAGQNYIGTSDLKDFVIGTNNLERMRVLSSGNVGMGTTTPATSLHLFGNTNFSQEIRIENKSAGTVSSSQLSLYNDIGDSGFMLFGSSTSTIYAGANGLSIGTSGLGNLELYTNNTPWMTINTTGNVGIGTATPAPNVRLAIKDGHFQSQQTTAPTIDTAITYVIGSQSLSSATDVAGNISILTTAAAGSVTIKFNKAYSAPPIVILTATNNFSASDMTKVWVTASATGFIVNFSNNGGFFPPIADYHTYSYHVIETF